MGDRTLVTTQAEVHEAGAARHHDPMDFTEEQRQLIRDSFANGASDAEFAVLLEVARARRLNPLLRQIHFVQRWDSEKHRTVWATQVSIDGLRALAERTGLYQGQDEPEFVENPDGTLKLCKVRVWRKDWPRPAVGVAYWNEYVQTTRDKQTGKTRPTAMWARMPHVMLSKCGEALALRKAFPEDMAGLYTTDEMSQAQAETLPSPRPEPARVVPLHAAQHAPMQHAPMQHAPMQHGGRTEVHIHTSLPAVASRPSEAPEAPSIVPIAPSEPTPPAAQGPAAPARKPVDPWLDYYG